MAGQVVASLGQRVLGRTAAEDCRIPSTGKSFVPRGELLEEPQVEAIERLGVQEVRIRSVLTCETQYGVCAKCYGRDLARGTPVNIGEAVGVIAAQSIGEPGTQLTMRTFHIGGAAQVAEQSFVESNHEGRSKIRNRNIVKNADGELIVMSRERGDRGRSTGRQASAPCTACRYGARLMVDDGDKVKRGERMAEWDPYTRPIITEVERHRRSSRTWSKASP